MCLNWKKWLLRNPLLHIFMLRNLLNKSWKLKCMYYLLHIPLSNIVPYFKMRTWTWKESQKTVCLSADLHTNLCIRVQCIIKDQNVFSRRVYSYVKSNFKEGLFTEFNSFFCHLPVHFCTFKIPWPRWGVKKIVIKVFCTQNDRTYHTNWFLKTSALKSVMGPRYIQKTVKIWRWGLGGGFLQISRPPYKFEGWSFF